MPSRDTREREEREGAIEPHDAGHDWRPSAGTIEAISKPAEDPQRAERLRAAAQGIEEHGDHYSKAQGRAAERAALVDLKPDGAVRDLNSTEAGLDGAAADTQISKRRPTFPIYDVASEKRVASVKCRGIENESGLAEAARNQYMVDFEEAIGRGNDPAKFRRAAAELHELACNDPDGYPETTRASAEQTEAFLRANAELRIPDDHVSVVRDELQRRLNSDDNITRTVAASRLGLDINSADYPVQVDSMLGRVRGIGLVSSEIRPLLYRRFR